MKSNNNKGFTLIEVLGVLIILCIIFVVVFPNVLNYFKKSEQAIDDATKKVIADAAKDYMDSNSMAYSQIEDSIYCLEINEMISKGYLDEEHIKNLDTNKKYIKVNYKEDKYTYEVCDTCQATSNMVFLLNGDKNVVVDINGTYTEFGAVAFDKDYNNISNLITSSIYDKLGNKVSYIDTTKLGKYTVEYKINLSNKEQVIIRNISVSDLIKPTITNNSTIDNFSDDTTQFDLLEGIVVTDNSGENISPVISSNLSLRVPGVYTITYTATDSSGNIGTLSRTIQIYIRDFSYPAVLACKNGTLENGVCKVTYSSNVTKCGCSTYNSCPNSSTCGSTTTTSYYSHCGSSNSCSSSSVAVVCYAGWTCKDGTVERGRTDTSCSTHGGTASLWQDCACGYGGGYSVSCPETITTPNSCPNASCGCAIASSCTITEETDKIYTCPDGGILNGTICNM